MVKNYLTAKQVEGILQTVRENRTILEKSSEMLAVQWRKQARETRQSQRKRLYAFRHTRYIFQLGSAIYVSPQQWKLERTTIQTNGSFQKFSI